MTKTMTDESLRMVMVGTGMMGQVHLEDILEHFPHTSIPVICEPSEEVYEEAYQIFKSSGRRAPKNEPDLGRLLRLYGDELDAAFIITPHFLHYNQAAACMEAGLDVLLEKPMVMNAAEARKLIDARDESGRLLVVAFDGGLSPAVDKARQLLRSGEAGELLTISATIWQDWRQLTTGTWRQDPHASGGGFLFDTGAHMLNTVVDLAGEEFTEVAAWFDKRGTDVEINIAAIGRLASGSLVSLHGSGETIPSCSSAILVYCSEAILRTGAWGRSLEIQHRNSDSFEPVEIEPSFGVWDRFLSIRKGMLANPTPPEIGLRFARLYDALKHSAENNGQPVQVT